MPAIAGGLRLMHIADGVLSGPVLAGGAALTVAGLAVGVRKMSDEDIPRMALLTAAFFVASIIHVPVGPASTHLVLNGLLGLILGWKAVPAIFVALILHAAVFRYGGLTSLGVNTVIMAAPALTVRAVFGGVLRGTGKRWVELSAGFGAGFGGVFLGALLAAAALALTGAGWHGVAGVFLAAYIPVMFVEGAVTAGLIHYIRTVKPELIER